MSGGPAFLLQMLCTFLGCGLGCLLARGILELRWRAEDRRQERQRCAAGERA